MVAGIRDPGELPGYLTAHSRERGPGQTPLGIPPDLPGESRLLWGSLRSSRLDSVCYGVHQKVCGKPYTDSTGPAYHTLVTFCKPVANCPVPAGSGVRWLLYKTALLLSLLGMN